MPGANGRDWPPSMRGHPAREHFDTYGAYLASDKRYCAECGDPLGSTRDRCHDCGGTSRRSGDPIKNVRWRVWLGA
jgi:hypothetical protein